MIFKFIAAVDFYYCYFIISFVQYRDIVSEVYILLLQCRPLIRPQMFVGQAGQKQKQQIKALENFRNNHVNVLISTSIGM